MGTVRFDELSEHWFVQHRSAATLCELCRQRRNPLQHADCASLVPTYSLLANNTRIVCYASSCFHAFHAFHVCRMYRFHVFT